MPQTRYAGLMMKNYLNFQYLFGPLFTMESLIYYVFCQHCINADVVKCLHSVAGEEDSHQICLMAACYYTYDKCSKTKSFSVAEKQNSQHIQEAMAHTKQSPK